jgi:hypothetical protein
MAYKPQNVWAFSIEWLKKRRDKYRYSESSHSKLKNSALESDD